MSLILLILLMNLPHFVIRLTTVVPRNALPSLIFCGVKCGIISGEAVVKERRHHPNKALTAVAVRQLKGPGRYADGNGLYLVVDASGARRWLLRTMVQGRRRDIGLGSARLVPLIDARDLAAKMRRLAREGGDPVEERRRRLTIVPTFKDVAEKVHAETAASWKNKRHADSWLASLETYAFPVLGSRRVDQIATADVLKVLSPIWLTKAETARRVRQRVRSVLDWARVAYGLSGANPVDGVERAGRQAMWRRWPSSS